MPSGITDAIITTLTNGTLANGPDVMASLNSLKSSGVNNDSGTITTNGSGGVSAASFTASGDVIAAVLKANTTPTTINGTTAGSASLYQFLQGTLKVSMLFFNGYRNASGTEQSITLPTAYTSKAFVFTTETKLIKPYSGGGPLSNCSRVITTLAAGGGTSTNQDTIASWSIGVFTVGFVAIGLGTSQATTATDYVLLIGI